MKTDATHNENEISLLFRRVENLERENKKLKRIALVFGLCVLALGTMGHARRDTEAVPRVVEAEKFVLRDADGKVRATLGTGGIVGPELKLQSSFDVDGVTTTVETTLNAAVLGMSRSGGKADGQMLLNSESMLISLMNKGEGERSLKLSASPGISIKDENGFETVVGRTDLESVKTGESTKTSAASIVILDKGGKVIWRAPNR